MRYHYKKPKIYFEKYGVKYNCNHEVYNFCTLYLINDKGLAVIQQRFNESTKSTYWSEIDPWLVTMLYTHEGFYDYFNKMSGVICNGIYPTVTVRQIMWALRMKPIKRESWETYFDRKNI